MLSQKILIVLTLVGAISCGYLNHKKLRDQRVFPDDENWLASFAKRKFENSSDKKEDVKNDKVCKTPECKKIADEFLSSMNKSVDPCNDFYDFACGGWSANNAIPPSYPTWSRYQMFQQTARHRIKGLLETKPTSSDILPVRQAKKWYRSCMDTESREERGLKPIESILMRAGGWPISMDEEEWDEDEYTWREIERYYARLTGSYTLFEVYTLPVSFSDNGFGQLMITPQDQPLSDILPLKNREYSGNEYDEYVQLIFEVASLFVDRYHADVSKEKLKEEVKDIVEFEKKLNELKKNEESEMMTLKEFVEWYDKNVTESKEDPQGKIDWQSMLQELFDIVNIKIHPLSDIYVNHLAYFRGIGELLRKTSSRTIVNFMHWNFVSNMLSYTTDAVRNELFDFVSEKFGIKEQPPRWSDCVDDMKMSHAASYAFVNKYFTEDTESAASDMIKTIQSEMETQIEHSNWLDEKSKIAAIDKLNSIKMLVGFPDWYKDEKVVKKSYKGLNIGNEYFDNVLSYMRFDKKKKLKTYSSSEGNEDLWFIDPTSVNAFYSRFANMLLVPAADFQSPLFTSNLPESINYGVVGVVIGHEISHGFDSAGIEYDKDGNETEIPENVLKNYYQRADCFTKQYNKYYGETERPETAETGPEDEDYTMSRSLMTREENIADSTGLQTVFEAYRKLKKSESSLRLPGLEQFTDDQLFFLSFGAMLCEVTTPEYKEKYDEMYSDDSPVKLRVIGAVSNTKDFSQAFNCPAGSPMNPTDKCNIWKKSDAQSPKDLARMKRKRNRWAGQWRI